MNQQNDKFYMTGFADEASPDIDKQIAVTKELGWKNIEARALYGKNIAGISDAEFEELEGKLRDAGVRINCYGSGIANWAKPITEPAESSYDELLAAAPRLRRLGTKYVRVMSFAVSPELRKNGGWELEDEVVRRMKHLVEIAEDSGLILLHENCQNWGGMSYRHTLRLLERVPSDALKLVFDTGNPVFNIDYQGDAPYTEMQSAWEFYKNVREFIRYIHIKDGYMDEQGQMHFTFAGEGKGCVPEIMEDLVKTGYRGGFSIEPHMAAVFHDTSVISSDEMRYQNYIEYGRRCEKMLRNLYQQNA